MNTNIFNCKFFQGLFLAILTLASVDTVAQIPNTLSVFGIGSSGADGGNSVVVDASGNTYLTGYYQGIVDFDPGAGVVNLSSNASSTDIFVSKYDPSGNLVWAKSIGGAEYDEGLAIVEDAGNVYITGYFNQTIDLDPGSGIANFTSINNKDMFILKLNTNGNYIWGQTFGHFNNDIGKDLTKDASGNIYLTGIFGGTIDFDSGPGIQNLSTNGNPQDMDIFICKFSPSGLLSWAKRIGGVNDDDNVFGIEIDNNGNIYTTGYFELSADFDPGPGITNLTSPGIDMFICKLNLNGDFLWANQIGGGTGTITPLDLDIDAAGNIYTIGNFSGTIDFDPGIGVANFTMGGFLYSDIFISKLNTNGAYVWTKTIPNPSAEWGNGITVDAGGNVYCTGYYFSTTDFDPGPGISNFTSAGAYDIFLLKLNSSGNFVWAKGMGGSNTDRGNDICLDPNGNIVTTGYYEGPANFNPSGIPYFLSGAGFGDIFILKTENLIALPVELIQFRGEIKPNGNLLHWETLSEQNNKCFHVERSTDAINFKTIASIQTLAEHGNSAEKLSYSFLDTHIYTKELFYRLEQLDINDTKTYSDIIKLDHSINNNIQVFPNPTNNSLFISCFDNDLGKDIYITGINGQIRLKQKIQQAQFSLDVKNLNYGIYFIRIGDQVTTFTKVE